MKILDQSLCHLDGLSPMTEISLRNRGIRNTRQLIDQVDTFFSPKHAERLRKSYYRLELARQLDLVDILVNSLPCGHRVRVLGDYYQSALFLDIETTGTQRNAQITCISTYRDGQLNSYVQGRNLDDFLYEWAQAKVVVAFNGKRFDLPHLQKAFNLATLPAQIDLMDEARHYGYNGGLKAIEYQIGFQRKKSVCNDGKAAIHFWEKYHNTNDINALIDLLHYNAEDVRILTVLWRIILKHSLENHEWRQSP